MNALLKKELRTLFFSPLAYIVMGVFLLITGYIFLVLVNNFSMMSVNALRNPVVADRVNAGDAIIRPLFQNLIFLLLIISPILTMRSFSEEKKLGTIELLHTYPLTEIQLIAGKFLGVLILAMTIVGATLVYPVMLYILAPRGGLEWGMIFSCYLGSFCLLLSFIALGLWASSLTDNLVISYCLTFGGLLLFWIAGWMEQFVNIPILKKLSGISLVKHTATFYKGVIDTGDIAFFSCPTVFILSWRIRKNPSIT